MYKTGEEKEGGKKYKKYNVWFLEIPAIFQCIPNHFSYLLSGCLGIKVRVCAQPFYRVWLFVTPWTIAPRLPCSWNFPGKNTEAGWPFPILRGLPEPEIEPMSLASSAVTRGFSTAEPPGKPQVLKHLSVKNLLWAELCSFVQIFTYWS